MKNAIPVALLWAVLGLGCQQGEHPTRTPGSHATFSGTKADPGKAALSGRLEAALAISDPSKRDSALDRVAQEAAEGGDAEVTKKALAQINNPLVRDATAAACAAKLAAAGHFAAGAEVAKTIQNPTRRDEALEKLAKGSPSPGPATGRATAPR
jgi:hypothetical protein